MVVAVCDDKQIYLDRVKSIIDSYLQDKGIESTVLCFASGDMLLDNLPVLGNADLFILDVEMPDSDGLFIASKIREYHETVPIAYLSAFMKYAPSGYRVRAIRYMLKNEDMDIQIQECLDCVLGEMALSERTLTFDFTVGARTLKVSNIIYLESKGNYTTFVLKKKESNEEIKVRSSLTKISNLVSSFDFVQINAKVSVNLQYVESVSRYSAKLNNGQTFVVSQKKYNDVARAFNLYRGRHL